MKAIFLWTLTDGLVGDKRLVLKAKNLGDIVEIGVLGNECPLCVVQPIVEICYGDFNTPIILVVKLHMPVNPYRAHMMCTLQQRLVVLPWCVYTCSL